MFGNGEPLFSDEWLQRWEVWQKGNPIIGLPEDQWRMDDDGNWICWENYGDRESPSGWEIDHRFPQGLGGPDELSNLRPMHWRANAIRGGLLGGLLDRF